MVGTSSRVTMVDVRDALAILKFMKPLYLPTANHAVSTRYILAMNDMKKLITRGDGGEPVILQEMGYAFSGDYRSYVFEDERFRNQLVTAMPSMSMEALSKILKSRRDGSHSIVKATNYARKHLELGNILRAAFSIASLPHVQSTGQAAQPTQAHGNEQCLFRIREAWRALDNFILDNKPMSSARFPLSAFEPFLDKLAAWESIVMNQQSEITQFLRPYHEHYLQLIDRARLEGWCNKERVPAQERSGWPTLLRYIAWSLRLQGSLENPQNLIRVKTWLVHGGDFKQHSVGLQHDGSPLAQAAAAAGQKFDITRQLIALIEDSHDFRALWSRRQEGHALNASATIKAAERQIARFQSESDALRDHARRPDLAIKAIETNLKQALNDPHVQDLFHPLMSELAEVAGHEFHSFHAFLNAHEAGLEQLVTFLATREIPHPHANVSEWHDWHCHQLMEAHHAQRHSESAHVHHDQALAVPDAFGSSTFSLARPVTSRDIRLRSSRMATMSRFLRDRHGQASAFGY